MRAVVQRVSRADVAIDGKVKSAIQRGLLILLGVGEVDTLEDVEWLTCKISRMRIFPDEEGVMNRSIIEVGGDALVLSQFTLHASTRKGNRPSYIHAARPEKAIPLYEKFVEILCAQIGREVGTGEFGGDMKVALVNDGPVTILIDSRNRE